MKAQTIKRQKSRKEKIAEWCVFIFYIFFLVTVVAVMHNILGFLLTLMGILWWFAFKPKGELMWK